MFYLEMLQTPEEVLVLWAIFVKLFVIKLFSLIIVVSRQATKVQIGPI